MEGIKKEEQKDFEKTKEENLKTKLNRTEEDQEAEELPKQASTSSQKAEKSHSLKAIFSQIQTEKEKWPQEMLLAILRRFERMPRFGWSLAHSFFCEKFGSIQFLEFKNRARKLIVSKNNQPCSTRDFKNHQAKRIKENNEVRSLDETKEYVKIKEMFHEKIIAIRSKDITKVERTPKIPADTLKQDVVMVLNRVAGEYAKINSPSQ